MVLFSFLFLKIILKGVGVRVFSFLHFLLLFYYLKFFCYFLFILEEGRGA